MKQYLMFYPVFALAGWTFIMAVVMLRSAIKAVGEGLNPEYFRYGVGEPPGYMRSAYQHYSNLFEMPVLFYVVVLATYILQQGNFVLLGLAWLYVAARIIHSLIHLKNRNIRRRRDSFLASNVVLILMWGVLFARLISVQAMA